MMETQKVNKNDLLTRVHLLLEEGARLANATCLDLGEKFKVIYHFHKGLDLVNLEVEVDKDEELPSLSGPALSAVLIENEMKEFFGINIIGIAIDFNGRMLLSQDSPRAPLLKSSDS